MARVACDGNGLLEAFRAAVANLEAHVEEINGLNVYPVPDAHVRTTLTALTPGRTSPACRPHRSPADRW